MKFSDIPQYLTNYANYRIDIPLDYFDKTIQNYIDEEELQLNPDFQRGYVWTEKQQIAFVEHILKGGKQGRDIYFNKPSIMYVLHVTSGRELYILSELRRQKISCCVPMRTALERHSGQWLSADRITLAVDIIKEDRKNV